jgi:hypothetical protein
MIPDGVVVESVADYAMMSILSIICHKFCRALNPKAVSGNGIEMVHLSDMGHQDSFHDIAVYMAILEEMYLRNKNSK